MRTALTFFNTSQWESERRLTFLKKINVFDRNIHLNDVAKRRVDFVAMHAGNEFTNSMQPTATNGFERW